MAMGSKTAIRKFRGDDLEPLRRLIDDTIDGSYAPVYPSNAIAFFKEFHSEQNILERSQAGTVLVCEEAGELTATGSVVDCEIFAVFVHPTLQHGGRGRALMLELEDVARSDGFVAFDVSVSLPAKRFYESLGYEITDNVTRNLDGGERLDFWKATKSLASE